MRRMTWGGGPQPKCSCLRPMTYSSLCRNRSYTFTIYREGDAMSSGFRGSSCFGRCSVRRVVLVRNAEADCQAFKRESREGKLDRELVAERERQGEVFL